MRSLVPDLLLELWVHSTASTMRAYSSPASWAAVRTASAEDASKRWKHISSPGTRIERRYRARTRPLADSPAARRTRASTSPSSAGIGAYTSTRYFDMAPTLRAPQPHRNVETPGLCYA